MLPDDKFKAAIAEAASHIDHGVADNADDPGDARPSRATSSAQAAGEAAFAALAAELEAMPGLSFVYGTPRAVRKKSAAEYGFWKRPVSMFLERPATLDIDPTDLAGLYAASEANFTVTRDTFYALLSTPARKEAKRMLNAHGHDLVLPPLFNIREVQLALKDKRDRAAGVLKFEVSVEVVGDKVYCNGKGYKADKTASGSCGSGQAEGGSHWMH